MRMLNLVAIGLVATASAVAQMPPADTAKAGKDHPLLSRFAGSRLVGYQAKTFDAVELVAGKYGTNAANPKLPFEKMQPVEGRITRLAYNYPADRSAAEVMRNYQQALAGAGFKTLFSCERDSCGGDFGDHMLQRLDKDIKVEGGSAYWEPFNHGRTEPRYLLASGQRKGGGLAYAAVYVAAPLGGKNGGVYLEIAEAEAMETGKVSATLSADEMAKGLAAEGKVALYGIYFDTDKAEVKPESKPALAEMAKLLKADAKLNVYIVGHTDNQGPLARNTELSQKRAEAVVAALAGEHKVDAKRLLARGVASLAPVAANDTEPGRAKNRRVELVRQ
jgi:outer membrane protein OmpA-like peptidoglycan-associated protein